MRTENKSIKVNMKSNIACKDKVVIYLCDSIITYFSVMLLHTFLDYFMWLSINMITINYFLLFTEQNTMVMKCIQCIIKNSCKL